MCYLQKSNQALKARYGKGTRMGSQISLSRSNLQLDGLSPLSARLARPGGGPPTVGEKSPAKTNQVAPAGGGNPDINIEVCLILCPHMSSIEFMSLFQGTCPVFTCS